MTSNSIARVAVDVGGTFTDVVLGTGSGLHALKVPSTYPDPSIGVMEGLTRLLAEQDIDPREVGSVHHATTVATNALLERRGARVALLVTDGFGDLMSIARLRRVDPFDLAAPALRPLVPRADVHEVPERVEASGRVALPLDEDAVRRTAAALPGDIEAVAVCFLHAHRFPTHEERVRQVLAEERPGLPVFLSHEVLPQPREYERASTTVIAAYLGPLVQRYLEELGRKLAATTGSSAYRVMKSSGGLVTAKHAGVHPEELVESGPAAGVIGAAALGRRLGQPDLIAFDMGGTTAKAALVLDGEHGINHEYEVGGDAHAGGLLAKGTGFPLRVPVVDLAEVGTGGGSIAWVDAAGALRVGPRSAGADPGPICYGRGGVEPTVTDAYVALGMIAPQVESHLGDLDVGGARAGFEALGARLGVDAATAARGVFQMATAQMADAVRLVTVARGHDPRGLALLASGGAGPVHAWALAAELSVDTVLVPPLAGVHSAVGLLDARPRIDHSAGVQLLSTDPGAEQAALAVLEELAALAAKDLANGRASGDPATQVHWSADIRYRGQSYELHIELPDNAPDGLAASMRREFETAHRRMYGHDRPEAALEIIALRARAESPAENGATPRVVRLDIAPRAAITRPVDFGNGPVETEVVGHDRLDDAAPVPGPVVFESPDTTVVVAPGWEARRREETIQLTRVRDAAALAEEGDR